MYGRRTPEEVHAIFTKYDVSYVILEDSICMAPSRGNCRVPDLIDIDNGIVSRAQVVFIVMTFSRVVLAARHTRFERQSALWRRHILYRFRYKFQVSKKMQKL